MHDQTLTGAPKVFFNNRRFLDFSMVARLRDDVPMVQAHSELQTIGADLEREFPEPNKGRTFAMLPLLESNIDPNLRGLFNRAGGLLMAVVGLVLLIACANIANLLLVRAASRKREMSIRLALGASRRRIIMQLLTEAVLLGLIGGGLGLVLAVIGRNMLWNFRPPVLQTSHLNLEIDGKVLLFNLLISLTAGITCGLAPALQSTRANLVSELKERAGSGDSAGRRFSLYHAAIVVEVGFCLICLVGAGLFLRSLENAQRIDPGFDTHNLAMLTFDVGSLKYDPPRVLSFQRQVLETARAVPGVTSATLSADIPLLGDPNGRTVFPEGEQGTSTRNGLVVLWTSIGDDYLRTMGIPLVSGQDFDSSVREDSRKVAIVNESAAKRFWPNQNPIGRHIHFYTGEEVSVIGVAHDSKYGTLGESATPYMYLPLVQSPNPQVTLFIRTSANPAAVISGVRSQVQALDRNLPLTNVWAIGEVISQQLWAARFAAQFLSLFAIVALILCAIGINGTIGYTVSRRVREIGLATFFL
jgi:putative ABC transport system permease protein